MSTAATHDDLAGRLDIYVEMAEAVTADKATPAALRGFARRIAETGEPRFVCLTVYSVNAVYGCGATAEDVVRMTCFDPAKVDEIIAELVELGLLVWRDGALYEAVA